MLAVLAPLSLIKEFKMAKEKSQRKIEQETLREMQKVNAMMKKVDVYNKEMKEFWHGLVEQTERIIAMQKILFENQKVISESGTIVH